MTHSADTVDDIITANVSAQSLAISGSTVLDWTINADQSVAFDMLTANSADVRDEMGTLLDSGSVVVENAIGVIQTAPVSLTLTADGTAVITPLPCLVWAAVRFGQLFADLSATQPYTIALESAEVVVDSATPYTGIFSTLAVTGNTAISGSGTGIVPNFATEGDGPFRRRNNGRPGRRYVDCHGQRDRCHWRYRLHDV